MNPKVSFTCSVACASGKAAVRAASNGTGFFIFDEPTSGMSTEESLETQSLMETVQYDPKGSVMRVVDTLDVVIALADRVILFDRGTALGQGARRRVIGPDAHPMNRGFQVTAHV